MTWAEGIADEVRRAATRLGRAEGWVTPKEFADWTVQRRRLYLPGDPGRDSPRYYSNAQAAHVLKRAAEAGALERATRATRPRLLYRSAPPGAG